MGLAAQRFPQFVFAHMDLMETPDNEAMAWSQVLRMCACFVVCACVRVCDCVYVYVYVYMCLITNEQMSI
jgi:hypothetical protein